MFRLIEAKTVPLTPELARKFRDMPPWSGERNLDAKRVKHLDEKRERNLLVPFQWAYCELDGVEYRMNAQHSANMLCALNGTFPEGLQAHVSAFKADEKKDLALLFRQYDDRVSKRGPLDISGAYQGLYEPLNGVARKTAKLAIEGVMWYRRTIVGMPTPKGDDIYEEFDKPELHPFITFAGSFYNSKTREMELQPVMAATYATFDVNETGAKDFWPTVALGGDPGENDGNPAVVLDDWLRSIAEKTDKRLLGLKAAQYYQGCICAWNAFRHNRSLKDIRFDTRKGILEVEH